MVLLSLFHNKREFFNIAQKNKDVIKLYIEYQKLKLCAQISTSINSDDLGVFDTNLENEYALIAIALENEKDENGNPKYCSLQIYKWLESVRQMGEEQIFLRLYE